MNSIKRYTVSVFGKVQGTFEDYTDAQTMSFKLQDYFEQKGLEDVIEVTVEEVIL